MVVGYFYNTKNLREVVWVLTATEQLVEEKLLVPWGFMAQTSYPQCVSSGLASDRLTSLFGGFFPCGSSSVGIAYVRQGSYIPEKTNHSVVFSFQHLRWNHNPRSGV